MTLTKRRAIHVFIILAALCLAYANSLSGPFQFDDSTYVLQSPVIKEPSLLLAPLESPAFESMDPYLRLTLRTRLIGHASFAANRAILGPSPLGYHAVNLAVHLANALLLYALITLTCRTPLLRDSAIGRCPEHPALAAALLFALHPVQTEAVSYVSQRFASLAAAFSMAALLLYSGSRMAGGASGRRLRYALSLASTALAMFTKENAFTLPLVIGIYEFVFFSGPRMRRAALLLPFALAMCIVPLSVMGRGAPLGEALSLATRTQDAMGRGEYALTQLMVVATYIRLIALPINQTIDYDYPLAHSALSPWAAVLHAALLCVAAILLRLAGRRPEFGLAGFGILWFYISLSVESSFVALADVIFEHRLYLPLAGACAAIAAFVPATPPGRPILRARTAAAAFLVALALLGVLTVERNKVWGGKAALWRDAAQKAPAKGRPLYSLGFTLFADGRWDEARSVLARASGLKTGSTDSYYKAGLQLMLLEEYDGAVRAFAMAAEAAPSDHAQLALGAGLEAAGRAAEAKRAFAKIKDPSVRADPKAYLKGVSAEAYWEGVRTEESGDQPRAKNLYERALYYDHTNARALLGLGTALAGEGRLDPAIALFKRAARIAPERPEPHNNLSVLYEMKGMREEAAREEEIFEALGKKASGATP